MIFGMVNWSVNWYRPDGPKTAHELAGDFADILLGGLRADREEDGEQPVIGSGCVALVGPNPTI
jgi:hypothetical protein